MQRPSVNTSALLFVSFLVGATACGSGVTLVEGIPVDAAPDAAAGSDVDGGQVDRMISAANNTPNAVDAGGAADGCDTDGSASENVCPGD